MVTGKSNNLILKDMLRRIDGNVEIHIKDYSSGIPQKVVNKIFQPFLTIEPTEQGEVRSLK